MIKFVNGDFFDFDAEIRVNTVNCVGVMGAGAALAFKNKYPEMYLDYGNECKKGTVKPGLPHVWVRNDMFKPPLTIINFPTKVHWKQPSEYEYIESGLRWLKTFLLDKEKKTVTLPALGCGHGGLDWSKVKNLIIQYLDNLQTEILVFEPQSSTKTYIEDEIQKKLNDEGIQRLLPSDINYPEKLKGKSAAEIYTSSDPIMLNNETISIIVDAKASEKEKNSVYKLLDSFPLNKFTFLLGYSSSFEKDLVKKFLERNERMVLTIPQGILTYKKRKDLEEVWDKELVTVISTSKPNQSWKPYENVRALNLRLALSDAVVLTYHNPLRLKNIEDELRGNNLFYINYWSNPNDYFKKIAAAPIGLDRQTFKPNLQKIFSSLKTSISEV